MEARLVPADSYDGVVKMSHQATSRAAELATLRREEHHVGASVAFVLYVGGRSLCSERLNIQ
jgi:hypothetical protein